MKRTFLRIIVVFLCLCFFCPAFLGTNAQAATYSRKPPARVENDPNDPEAAQNITDIKLVTHYSGFQNIKFLFNNLEYSTNSPKDSASLTIEYADGIGYLYLIFDGAYEPYTMTNNDTGTTVTVGQNGFLHDLVDLTSLFGAAPSSVTVNFANGPVYLTELMMFSPGYLPDYVQVWEPAKAGETDLILFSTHGDDDQLFFAGLLPYYTALDYEVLVVYMADHSIRQTYRLHEMLNGLWNCGVTTYPVLGRFGDFFEEDIEVAYRIFQQSGVTKNDIVEYVTEQIRIYTPKVVVGHDFAGEYSHAQHMIFAECLAAAVEISNDPSQFPESAEAYGVWDVPKAYFHLYEENPIVMDWDTPMEELDGYTPFQITQLFGYTQHVSQQESWVSNWINGINFSIDKASQITEYSPCEYGLYRTTVGLDVEKNDFFENVTTHAEDAIWEAQRLAEEAAAEEAAAEEARKAEEAERLAAEEAARKAAEQKEAYKIEAEKAEKKQKIMLFSGSGVLLLVSFILIILIFRKR